MTYTQILKDHACNWVDMFPAEIAEVVGCPYSTAVYILREFGIKRACKEIKFDRLKGVDTSRYDPGMLAEKTGLNRAYVVSMLRKLGRPYKPTKGHVFSTGRKADHCEAYALKHNKSFMTVTQCYHNEKSASKLGKLWGLTGGTIREWVKQEGGKMLPKGGSQPGAGRKRK